jgi:hypothetical protein
MNQEAELVQEILSLIDTAVYPPYEIMPALSLACSWLAQSSGGHPAALSRLEKAHAQMQNRQTAACLNEVRAIGAGLRDEWAQAASCYEAAAAHWEALRRPYDLLRTLSGLTKVLSYAQLTGAQGESWTVLRDVGTKTSFIIEQLANELDEPEVKQAFLASPLVLEIRRGQKS